MTHRIKIVKPLENMMISVIFQNGVEKEYDMRNLYPVFPQFEELEKNRDLFSKVEVDVGGYGISWNDKLDLDAEDIWEDGIEVCKHEVNAAEALANNLIKTRDFVGMTQKQLAQETGIYQSDISKIERGLANPSLSTLQRLADGMGVQLKIEFLSE